MPAYPAYILGVGLPATPILFLNIYYELQWIYLPVRRGCTHTLTFFTGVPVDILTYPAYVLGVGLSAIIGHANTFLFI